MKSKLMKFISVACILYTAFMSIMLPLAYYFAGPSEGLNISTGLLVGCFAMAAIQFVWFTETFIKRMRYAFRLLGFFITGSVVLFAIGMIAGWFPFGIGSAITFFVIFAVIFALLTVGYTIYFRRKAGSYDKALEEYRKNRDHRE